MDSGIMRSRFVQRYIAKEAQRYRDMMEMVTQIEVRHSLTQQMLLRPTRVS
jgi:ATP-dependent phosphoenolpyruvate carboxykinase